MATFKVVHFDPLADLQRRTNRNNVPDAVVVLDTIEETEERIQIGGLKSFYGLNIPLSIGTRQISGVPIWVGERDPRSASFAVSFGYSLNPQGNQRVAVRRMWFNDTLVVDRTGESDMKYRNGVSFQMYGGTETQAQNGAIVAKEGEENTPAFRGLIYAVFSNIDLQRLGFFEIPVIRAELEDRSFNTVVHERMEAPTRIQEFFESHFRNTTTSFPAADGVNNRVYRAYTGSGNFVNNQDVNDRYRPSFPHIVGWSNKTKKIIVSGPVLDVNGNSPILADITLSYFGVINRLILTGRDQNYDTKVFIVNPHTLRIEETLGTNAPEGYYSVTLRTTSGLKDSHIHGGNGRTRANLSQFRPKVYLCEGDNQIRMRNLARTPYTQGNGNSIWIGSMGTAEATRPVYALALQTSLYVLRRSRTAHIFYLMRRKDMFTNFNHGIINNDPDAIGSVHGHEVQVPEQCGDIYNLAFLDPLTLIAGCSVNAALIRPARNRTTGDIKRTGTLLSWETGSELQVTDLDLYGDRTVEFIDLGDTYPRPSITRYSQYGNWVTPADSNGLLTIYAARGNSDEDPFQRVVRIKQNNLKKTTANYPVSFQLIKVRETPGYSGAREVGIFSRLFEPIYDTMGHYIFEGGFSYTTQQEIHEYDLFGGTSETFRVTENIMLNGATWGTFNFHSVTDSKNMVQYENNGWAVKSVTYGNSRNEYPLREFLQAICLRVGFTASEISISADITDQYWGSIINAEMDFWALMENMSLIYGFNVFESGGRIRFTKTKTDGTQPVIGFDKTRDSIAPLRESSVGDEPGESFKVERIGEKDLPNQINVAYIDYTQGYKISEVYTRRTSYPRKVTQSDAKAMISVPICMSPSEALTRAQNLLFDAWLSRTTYELRLPRDSMLVEPGDYVRYVEQKSYEEWDDELQDFVVVTDTTNHIVEVASVILNADWSSSLAGSAFDVRDRRDIVVNPFDYQTGRLRVPTNGSLVSIDTKCFDVELDKDLNEDEIFHPVGFQNETFGRFTNARMEVLDNQGQSYLMGNILSYGDIGRTESALPNVTNTNTIHEDTLGVRFVENPKANSFASQSMDAFLRKDRLVLVGEPGTWEVLTYRDATVTGNYVELKGLIRGLKGTEANVGKRRMNEMVIPLNEDFTLLNAALSLPNDPDNIVGEVKTINVIGYQQAPDEGNTRAVQIAKTWSEPYDPTNIRAKQNLDNISIMWDRRSRENSYLNNGVPVAPAFYRELRDYSIRLYSDTGVLIRQVDGITTETYTYTNAMKTEDYGDSKYIYISVVQKSTNELVGYPVHRSIKKVEVV